MAGGEGTDCWRCHGARHRRLRGFAYGWDPHWLFVPLVLAALRADADSGGIQPGCGHARACNGFACLARAAGVIEVEFASGGCRGNGRAEKREQSCAFVNFGYADERKRWTAIRSADYRCQPTSSTIVILSPLARLVIVGSRYDQQFRG
jgi:hypothetical protein